jgi:hypothetical protein
MDTLEKEKMKLLGSKGGRATAEKHGSAYMREIGLKGLDKRYAEKRKKALRGRKEASNQSNTQKK